MICAIAFFSARAQHTANLKSFDGVWAGVLKDKNDKESLVVVKILNGLASRYDYNDDTKKFEKSSFIKENSMVLGNNLSFTWMNKGGIWSENQTYMISYLKPNVLYCRLIRQVNNVSEDKNSPGMNDEWSTYFEGALTHYDTIAALEKALL